MESVQSRSNQNKARSGEENFSEVKNVLTKLKKRGLIKEFIENVNISHKDYKYKNQFKIDFKIKTIDDKFIIIRTSKSYRSDRVKIFFYDFIGANLYSKFSEKIVASIILFPDKEIVNKSFNNNRKKFIEKEFYSPATHWLTKSEFLTYIENYKYEVVDLLNEEEERLEEINYALFEEDKKYKGSKYTIEFNEIIKKEYGKEGSYYGKTGFMLEKYLVDNLNDPENLISYKNNQRRCVEYDLIMDGVLKNNQLQRKEVLYIEATDSITKLKTLGSAKTDIHAKLHLISGKVLNINLSVKNASDKPVTCHDYRAEDFCRVINDTDNDFCEAVTLFQKAGSWKSFKGHVENNEKRFAQYVSVLRNNMDAIIKWAITGAGDEENIMDETTQIANYIFIRRRDRVEDEFYSATEYMELLKKRMLDDKRPGAPFSWTYPSKNRGSRIQLKMPVL